MNPLQPFDSNTRLLEKILDLRANNSQVISTNIANAETPGYSPARFSFEENLRQAIDATSTQLTTSHKQHISLQATSVENVTGTITVEPDTHALGDENGVSVDDEMLALSENQLLYEAAAQLLKKKFSMMSYAISGGQ